MEPLSLFQNRTISAQGSIHSVPCDILVTIFIESQQSSKQLALVCKTWNQIIHDSKYDRIWKHLFLRTFGNISEKINKKTFREKYMELVQIPEKIIDTKFDEIGKAAFKNGLYFNQEDCTEQISFNPREKTITYNTKQFNDQHTFVFGYETDQILKILPVCPSLNMICIPCDKSKEVMVIDINRHQMTHYPYEKSNESEEILPSLDIQQILYHEGQWIIYSGKLNEIQIYDASWQKLRQISVNLEKINLRISSRVEVFLKKIEGSPKRNSMRSISFKLSGELHSKSTLLIAYKNKLVTLHHAKHLAIWNIENGELLEFGLNEEKKPRFVYNDSKIVCVSPTSMQILDLNDAHLSFSPIQLDKKVIEFFYEFLSPHFHFTKLSSKQLQEFCLVRGQLLQLGMPSFGNYHFVSTFSFLIKMNKEGKLFKYSFFSKFKISNELDSSKSKEGNWIFKILHLFGKK